jgi:hypothetical protein
MKAKSPCWKIKLIITNPTSIKLQILLTMFSKWKMNWIVYNDSSMTRDNTCRPMVEILLMSWLIFKHGNQLISKLNYNLLKWGTDSPPQRKSPSNFKFSPLKHLKKWILSQDIRNMQLTMLSKDLHMR